MFKIMMTHNQPEFNNELQSKYHLFNCLNEQFARADLSSMPWLLQNGKKLFPTSSEVLCYALLLDKTSKLSKFVKL